MSSLKEWINDDNFMSLDFYFFFKIHLVLKKLALLEVEI